MKCVIIYNPAAGAREKQAELRQVATLLGQHGWQVEDIQVSPTPAETTAQARRAAQTGCDAVFVAGGDGTLSRAAGGLVGSETALGVLPAGTANVLARQLNLPVPSPLRPRPMLDAAALLVGGRARPVDLGLVRVPGETRHFICWTGVGFDAHVAKAVDNDAEQKRRLGTFAFAIAAVMAAWDYRGTRTVVRLDGQRQRGRTIMLVANNIQIYGAWIPMAPEAVLDDGWLDIYTLRGRNSLRTFGRALQHMVDRRVHVPEVAVERARRIEVIAARPLPVHVDGDALGYTPAVIEVVPRALRLLVPAVAPASLFCGD